jgi:uncharacterized protein (TIGR02246 family)
VTEELDAYWAELARTVEEGDDVGYGALYHPDAVLVVGGQTSMPIADALAGWKQLFVDTAEGKTDASVVFRFTERVNSETTAHETGMFAYSSVPAGEEAQATAVHFTALLVKVDGEWLMVMEHQKQVATDEEWAAAAP